MPNVTNTLIANITTTEDSTGAIPINRSTGNPALDSTVANMIEYYSLTVLTVIGLPISPVYQLYIRNLDPNGHIMNVTWTSNGGASNLIANLAPQDQIILWQKPGGTGAGITGLSLAASAYPLIFEMFLGG